MKLVLGCLCLLLAMSPLAARVLPANGAGSVQTVEGGTPIPPPALV